jgi:hypothetical protein
MAKYGRNIEQFTVWTYHRGKFSSSLNYSVCVKCGTSGTTEYHFPSSHWLRFRFSYVIWKIWVLVRRYNFLCPLHLGLYCIVLRSCFFLSSPFMFFSPQRVDVKGIECALKPKASTVTPPTSQRYLYRAFQSGFQVYEAVLFFLFRKHIGYWWESQKERDH